MGLFSFQEDKKETKFVSKKYLMLILSKYCQTYEMCGIKRELTKHCSDNSMH